MPTFGNLEIGDQFIHALSGDVWGSIFEAPEDRFAKSIVIHVKNNGEPSRVRGSLYDATDSKRLRFIMSTEEKLVPAGFQGKINCRFTAPPPIKKGVKYWINGWADEYSIISIASKTVSGVFPSAEWTSYMRGEPHGLSYPRFYEIIPQGVRIGCLCSIYCVYDDVAPLSYKCPYCGTEFSSYEETVAHIALTPTEMITLQICSVCGRTYYLKEQLERHMFEKHNEGIAPTHYSCIFCPFTAPTAAEVYNHINTNHQPVFNGGELPLSFEKTVTEIMAAKGPRTYKFIRAETEPDPPTDYERAPEWDLDFGILGKYWAFRATA